MNVAVRHRIMSIEDFLAWEARQELKHEFDGFEPVAMAGGTLGHARIQRNLATAVDPRLAGSPCEFLGSDMKVVSASQVRYPDGQVVCTRAHGDTTFTTTPVILFEVASDSSRTLDLGKKAEEYLEIASVQRYVVFEQDRVAATLFTRAGQDWQQTTLGKHASLEMPEVGIVIPLLEIYRGVEFPASDTPPP